MNRIRTEDCEMVGNCGFIDWTELENATILITGSTGLIGSNLVNAIAYNSKKKNLNIRMILPVRNTDKARDLFGWTDAKIIHYSLGDELNPEEKIDYIVHLASPTSSAFFKDRPAETILNNIDGIRALLEYARLHPVKKLVYISTMEVYGYPEKGHPVTESEIGAFDPMSARNSYPIAKIAGEALCRGYYTQYDVPAVILRATQTFGPGVDINDGRVFAQFMRCATEGKNIVLKSRGLTERPYLYTADAASAILASLTRAEAGNSYTIANPATYISIKDMAEMVAERIADGGIIVEYDLSEDPEKLGYANTLYMDLDVSKFSDATGWQPGAGLEEMFRRMIEGVSE